MFFSFLLLLDLGSVQMVLAWILTPTTGSGVFPCTRSTKRSPLRGTNRLWDLWGRMRTHEHGPLFLSFSSHVWVWQPRGFTAREGDDVMAVVDWWQLAEGLVTAQYIVTSQECNGAPAIMLHITLLHIVLNSCLQPYIFNLTFFALRPDRKQVLLDGIKFCWLRCEYGMIVMVCCGNWEGCIHSWVRFGYILEPVSKGDDGRIDYI
jgi:hypothetical protein